MLVDNITPRTAGNCHWDTFKHFWYPYNNDHLLPALASFRNIKCLSCAEATENAIGFRKEISRFENLDTFNDSLEQVKATMESGYVLQTERGLAVSMSGAYIDQTKRSLEGGPALQRAKKTRVLNSLE